MDIIKVIMHGCNGRMGRMITELAAETEGVEIVAGVDTFTEKANDYPVFKTIGECDIAGDVIIDFSNASAVDDLLDYAVQMKIPVVLCSTGLSEEQLSKMKKASQEVAILKSANMSLGINLLMKLLAEAEPVLSAAGFDIEIVEQHHNKKLDAPSGTALALADAMNSDGKYEYIYDRSTRRAARDKKEIGISAVRGGTIVGEHDVIFAGTDEVIRFSHSAGSRAVFAKGALSAAVFLAGKPAGMYGMQEVVG